MTIDDDEAIERLDGLLEQAVRSQLMSDVPLGAYLSGGLDSSVIVALMSESSKGSRMSMVLSQSTH